MTHFNDFEGINDYFSSNIPGRINKHAAEALNFGRVILGEGMAFSIYVGDERVSTLFGGDFDIHERITHTMAELQAFQPSDEVRMELMGWQELQERRHSALLHIDAVLNNAIGPSEIQEK